MPCKCLTPWPAIASLGALLVACAAPPPAAPVSRTHDGAYMFTIALERVISGAGCTAPGDIVQRAEVREGQFSLPYNNRLNVYLTGPVAPDGAIRAEGQLPTGPVVFVGRVAEGGLSGQATSPNCIYRISAFR